MGSLSYLRSLTANDAEALLGLRVKNRDFLDQFEPVKPVRYFTLSEQRRELEYGERMRQEDRRYVFGVYLTEGDILVGRISVDNVVRGAWQNATIGYFIDRENNGRGLGTEAVKAAIHFAFEEAQLHRLQAGVMPRNIASVRVLEKAGFRYEGTAARYLNINGVWEDHALYAVTVEDVEGNLKGS